MRNKFLYMFLFVILMTTVITSGCSKSDTSEPVYNRTIATDEASLSIPEGIEASFNIEHIEEDELEVIPGSDYQLAGSIVSIDTDIDALNEPAILTLEYNANADINKLVVLHFKEGDISIEEGEIDIYAGTITVKVDNFSDFGVYEKDFWERPGIYIQPNYTYTFDTTDDCFVAYDRWGILWNRDTWGIIQDPTGKLDGNVLFSTAVHNEQMSGKYEGYEKKMKSCFEFIYSNHHDDVEEASIEFDLSMSRLNSSTYLYLQARTEYENWSTLLGTVTIGPNDNEYKYIYQTFGDVAHVKYDLSDLSTWAINKKTTIVWGDPDRPEIYFRIVLKNEYGNDELGTYIDNLRFNLPGVDTVINPPIITIGDGDTVNSDADNADWLIEAACRIEGKNSINQIIQSYGYSDNLQSISFGFGEFAFHEGSEGRDNSKLQSIYINLDSLNQYGENEYIEIRLDDSEYESTVKMYNKYAPKEFFKHFNNICSQGVSYHVRQPGNGNTYDFNKAIYYIDCYNVFAFDEDELMEYYPELINYDWKISNDGYGTLVATGGYNNGMVTIRTENLPTDSFAYATYETGLYSSSVQSDSLSPANFFPAALGMGMKYYDDGGGMGDMYVEVEYVEGNRFQTREYRDGINVVIVYEVTDSEVKIVYEEYTDYGAENKVNMLDKTECSIPVIKGPIKVGTMWVRADYTYEITSVNSQISTPLGDFEAIEITSEGEGWISYYYYVKGIGLVRLLENYGYPVTTDLYEVTYN